MVVWRDMVAQGITNRCKKEEAEGISKVFICCNLYLTQCVSLVFDFLAGSIHVLHTQVHFSYGPFVLSFYDWSICCWSFQPSTVL